ncbi:hypothetical protein L1049_027510 [Liquidambar formosana]|uniref:Uncharacterized protein n=1 Tax=Liquidambar formosana TaxID=63359 RepID=A0AAP0RIV1_LIQFO
MFSRHCVKGDSDCNTWWRRLIQLRERRYLIKRRQILLNTALTAAAHRYPKNATSGISPAIPFLRQDHSGSTPSTITSTRRWVTVTTPPKSSLSQARSIPVTTNTVGFAGDSLPLKTPIGEYCYRRFPSPAGDYRRRSRHRQGPFAAALPPPFEHRLPRWLGVGVGVRLVGDLDGGGFTVRSAMGRVGLMVLGFSAVASDVGLVLDLGF